VYNPKVGNFEEKQKLRPTMAKTAIMGYAPILRLAKPLCISKSFFLTFKKYHHSK